MHATFRGAPGSDLAVLTLTRFPARSPGEHDVLWIRTGQGWKPMDLREADGSGNALQILEAPWLAEGWPLELRIQRDTRSLDQPSGKVLVEWRQPSNPGQPAFP